MTFERLFAFLVLGHGRRQLLWFEVTLHPTAEWLASAPAYLVRDNDRAYGDVLKSRASAPKTTSVQESAMTDRDIRAALNQHWAASDANDFELEHQIYREDAVLEYPQSGERIRGRRNIQITRTLQPSRKRFKVRRVIGRGDLWVSEYVILYDGQPSYTVSIMEFEGGKVARETQYFGDPFEASAWRSRWVEPMEREQSVR